MTAGIVSWGTYLPSWRLSRAAIGAALGTRGAKGTRSVASYDEDTTTMAVEAGRQVLQGERLPVPEALYFSTPAPAYLDKTNATTIHAALGLPTASAAFDLGGSARSALGVLELALLTAGRRPSLCLFADLRTGLAGSAEESDSGDGAVGFLCGPTDAVAELVGTGSASDEFLDRWRVVGEDDSHIWEERFGETLYIPLAQRAFADALKGAGLTESEVDHVIVSGLHARAVKAVTGGLGVRKEAVSADFAGTLGNLGAAQAGVALADVLDRAGAGETIAIVSLADGADVVLLRTTAELESVRARRNVPTVARQATGARDDLVYTTFLSWRGQLHKEPPRRPDPERPGAPSVHRSEGWKYGFEASRCQVCGFRHLPPTRVCLQCKAVDQMAPERLADVAGTVATFTIDRLAFSPSPPVVGVVVDFDGGGRYRCEMTDAVIDQLEIGTRVDMTFRRIYSAKGVHNYFWKARPLREAPASEEA